MSARPIDENDLHAYVDERLDAARRAEVEDFLKTRPETARRIAIYRAQSEDLRAALGPIADEQLPPELQLEWVARPRPAPSWRRLAAAVALLALGAGAGWLARGLGSTPGEGLPALAREAAANFAIVAVEAAGPIDLPADGRDALVRWTQHYFGRPAPIPDLAAAGYQLLGGRRIAVDHGAALLLIYQNDAGARLALLTRPMAVDANAPMAPGGGAGVNSFSWSDDGLGYSLVGPLDPAVLHPLADAARRQIRRNLS